MPVVNSAPAAKLGVTMVELLQFPMLKRWLVILALGLSGCNFFAAPDQGAQDTVDQGFATEIATLRLTATFEIDRLMATQEGLQTAVREVESQNTRTAVTLIALGTTVVDTSGITPLAPLPTVPPGAADSGPVLITPGASSRGSIDSAAEATPVPTAQSVIAAPAGGPAVLSVTLSEAVGADDCAAGSSTSFASTTGGIYAVLRVTGLTAQNAVTYRWQREGIEVWVDSWSPSANVEDACIWYYLTPAEVEFTAGDWSIWVAIDDQGAGAPVAFTISG